jgi:DNA polymerase-3 subunit gamma/tau
MRDAPDPRVLLEVALVRQCRPDADVSAAALLERIERLERGQAGQGVPIPSHDEPPRPAPKATRPADGARAALGGVRVPEAATPPNAPPTVEPRAAKPAPPAKPVESLPASDVAFPSRDALTLAWGDVVLVGLAQRPKVRFGAGHFVGVDGDSATFALPNTVHRDRCEECRDEVELALAAHFGRPVPLRLIVAEPGTPPEAAPAAPPAREPDDEIDLTDLRDAPPAGVTSPIDHVMQAFEGAQVVED